MYEAEFELEAELEDLMAGLAESDLEWEAEQFAPPAVSGPIFDLQCTGCAPGQCVACQDGSCAACPVAGNRCRTVLREAIMEAITLANNAADKLEAAIKVPPAMRDKDAKETARLFTAFFCHDPSLFISWAGGPSGASIAERFRMVARELSGGRRIIFICRPDRVGCPDTDDTCCLPGTEAFTLPQTPGRESTLFLCPRFWRDDLQRQPGLPAVTNRAGTIIHEMLHMLYGFGPGKGRGILDSDPKRANAHCHNAFVLRVNKYGRDRVSTAGCGSC